MRYLIDTNILIFWITGEDCIEDDVEAIFDDANNVIYISSLTLTETLHLLKNERIKTKYKSASELLNAITEEFYLQVIHTKKRAFGCLCYSPFSERPQ